MCGEALFTPRSPPAMLMHNLHSLSTDLSTHLNYCGRAMFCRWLRSCSHRKVVVHTFGPFIHGSMAILRHLNSVELYPGQLVALGERQCSRFLPSPHCELSTHDVEKLAKRGQPRDSTQYGDLASFAPNPYASHNQHAHQSSAHPNRSAATSARKSPGGANCWCSAMLSVLWCTHAGV